MPRNIGYGKKVGGHKNRGNKRMQTYRGKWQKYDMKHRALDSKRDDVGHRNQAEVERQKEKNASWNSNRGNRQTGREGRLTLK